MQFEQTLRSLRKEYPEFQKFQAVLYAIVALLWIHAISDVAIGLLWGYREFTWTVMVKDLWFAGLITLTVIYFYKRFREHVTDREKGYIKLFLKNPHPMWVYDLATLQFLLVNEAALRLYGYSEEEFLSMTIKDIRPDEDVPALISATDRIKLKFNLNYNWSGTWRHKKKNNELMYVDVSSHEIIFEGKKSEFVLAYNVTEQVNKDVELQRMNQDLERKVDERTNDLLFLNHKLIDQNKVIRSSNLELFSLSRELQEANERIRLHADIKNRFISMASHEFRTPLSTIRFAAGFIKRYYGKADGEKILDKILNIEKQVSHMTLMLDDVLTLGKANASKIEVKMEPVNLRDFAGNIAREVGHANNNTHEICLTLDDATPDTLHTDERLLKNIFMNLLNNAVKYSPQQPVVYFDVAKRENNVVFTVKDQGIGMRTEELDKIFEPFYRINSSDDIQGTGLGLSIVKRAADLIRARLDVASEYGRGSVFTVSLPVFVEDKVSFHAT